MYSISTIRELACIHNMCCDVPMYVTGIIYVQIIKFLVLNDANVTIFCRLEEDCKQANDFKFSSVTQTSGSHRIGDNHN